MARVWIVCLQALGYDMTTVHDTSTITHWDEPSSIPFGYVGIQTMPKKGLKTTSLVSLSPSMLIIGSQLKVIRSLNHGG